MGSAGRARAESRCPGDEARNNTVQFESAQRERKRAIVVLGARYRRCVVCKKPPDKVAW